MDNSSQIKLAAVVVSQLCLLKCEGAGRFGYLVMRHGC